MTSSSELDGRRTLVTGGAGFIGSHLVDALLAAGAHVRVLDNLSTGNPRNLDDCRQQIDFLEGDIRDFETCRSACDDIALVFHQAALGSVPRSLEDPASTVDINVTGSANIFAAAREAGVDRVIYASSSSVYGDSERLPKREGEEGRPMSPYSWSKRMTEELAEAFTAAYDLEFVGLRYFNVYGPRQNPDGPYAAVVPRFFAAALGNSPALIYGDGEQSRDFTSVRDAVAANLLAAEAQSAAAGMAYNVAGGRALTVNALALAVFERVGRLLSIERRPPRAGDVRHSLADLELVGSALGYQARTSLAAGLEDCLASYRADFP